MKRTIEKLHQERREKEEDLAKRLDDLRKASEPSPLPSKTSLEARLRTLEDRLRAEETLGRKIKDALQPLSRKGEARPTDARDFEREVLAALGDLRDLVTQAVERQDRALASFAGLLSLSQEVTDAKDKEWDALGSNHVGLIFKSMEWRVESLAAEYEDVKILMRKFLLLEDRLTRLLAALEDKKLPSPAQAAEILQPIRDWRYAGFENRFRGSEEEVRAQLAPYAALFKKGGRVVLDLGCGRGEFLELLKQNGLEAEGVDLNGLNVEACRDKGLDCRRGDLLEDLAGRGDGSLGGVFASQVIEHLPPPAIKRLIELAFAKLAPSGLVVLETINPLSLFALVNVYFLDPTHLTPVHPRTARFLLETAGFRDVEVRYSAPLDREKLRSLPSADETSTILNRDIDALNDLIYAPQNYAVIGTKR